MNDQRYHWTEGTSLRVEGRLWDTTPSPYSRLPAQLQSTIDAGLWGMACKSAGIGIRLITNACEIRIRWRVRREPQTNPRETAATAAGVDCYGKDPNGSWYWVGCTVPDTPANAFDQAVNLAPLDGLRREYRLYLPLDSVVESISVGVPAGCELEAPTPDTRPPVIMYGTSIIHGFYASRPGLTVPAMLGRRLDYPMVNLGFSGTGRMDPPVAQALSRVHAALLVVDCLPNMHPELLRERMAAFIGTIRAQQPLVPLLFVQDRLFGDARFIPVRRAVKTAGDLMQQEILDELQRQGVDGLHRTADPDFFGSDADGTVDGSHPNDIGMLRFSDKLEPVIRALLQGR